MLNIGFGCCMMAILGHLRAILGPGGKDVAEGCFTNWFYMARRGPRSGQDLTTTFPKSPKQRR